MNDDACPTSSGLICKKQKWFVVLDRTCTRETGVWKCTETELSLTLAETLSMTIIALLLLVGMSPLVGATEAGRISGTVQ